MLGRYSKLLCVVALCLVLLIILIQPTYFIIQHWSVNSGKSSSVNQTSAAAMVRKTVSTFCSLRATQRGFGQKVISISLFGPVENPKMFSLNKSLTFVQELLYEIQQVYADDWILRVYHDKKFLNKTTIRDFEQRYSFIDFCNITDMDLDYIPPRIWRFLPAGDEMVSVMVSRDLDSPLTSRERAAVDEWLSSKFSFHSMRDHPYHVTAVMAGMWGFRPEYDRNLSSDIRSTLLDRRLVTIYALNTDQDFLGNHLWPFVRQKAMTHDSYLCSIQQWNPNHRPFPTERPVRNLSFYCYIGCPKPCCARAKFFPPICPQPCRPKNHRDWRHC